MTLLLPFIVLGAAGLYFLARHEGWLDNRASRSPRPPDPGSGRKKPPGDPPGGQEASADRLAVFEEFLGGFPHDDGKDQG